MKKKHRTLRSLGIIALLTVLITTGFAPHISNLTETKAIFTNLDLHANIETVGIILNGKYLPDSAELMYRQANETEWKLGHPLMHIDSNHLVGSLFGLTESTSYEVKVTDGKNEMGGFITTQPNQLQYTPSRVVYVDDDAAPGGDGSATAPFTTIQSGINIAGPGTQVLVADGIYREEVTFPASGTENNWIQVKAAGYGAVLDGSRELSGDIWKRAGYKNVWATRVVTIFQYLARDGERSYRFDSLADLVNTQTYNGTVLKEGWFFDAKTLQLYVRSLDDPADHTWQLPMLNRAFSAKEQNWLWIEGFEVGHYGTTTSSCGMCITDTSHVVIRKNKIHHIQIGVFIKWTGEASQGNDTRIEYNEIYDSPVNEWPWQAVKSTSMEGTAIIVRGHIGTIVRGNNIHNYFNGIYTGSSGDPHNFELALDADIYNNYIHDISDDAFEPEGTCVNHRFRDNLVKDAFVGLSLAPITKGPTWALRNVFAPYTGRGIKLDNRSDGIALVYQNTFWSDKKKINAIDLISPAYNIVMRNNIFQSNGYLIKEAPSGSTGNYWDNNNLYTTQGALSPAFMWGGAKYYDIKKFCKATNLECNSYTDDPGFTDPEHGIFALQANSPNIDRGILIPGINDNFTGSAPDIGAYEYDLLHTAPTVASIVSTNENPTVATDMSFRVTFTEPVVGVGLLPPFDGFKLATNPNMPTATITTITPVSNTTYDVNVNTGGPEGTIRLDIVDDNSIRGWGFMPLGGPEPGDGTFTKGDSYLIDRTSPAAILILPLDPNPTPADSVRFSVNFSEPVSGVDKSDFTLSTNGSLTGANIVSVTGGGSVYIVTAYTDSGEGSLHMNILDDDSIVDIMGYPLGGEGIGNGVFSSGQDYIMAKASIVQTTKIFYSSGKYDGWILESSPGSNKGGKKNARDGVFYLGDDADNRQYRAILHFDISLPDSSVISKVVLLIKRKELFGIDPFTTYQNILVDIPSGVFGSFGPFPIKGLQKSDFRAPASVEAVGRIGSNLLGEWYWTSLDSAAFQYLTQSDTLQVRLRFDEANNTNLPSGYWEFYSGDSEHVEDYPQLLIEYYERK